MLPAWLLPAWLLLCVLLVCSFLCVQSTDPNEAELMAASRKSKPKRSNVKDSKGSKEDDLVIVLMPRKDAENIGATDAFDKHEGQHAVRPRYV